MINELITVEGNSSLDLHNMNDNVLDYIETINQFISMLESSDVTDTFYRKLTSSSSYLTEELVQISKKLTNQIYELEREDKIKRGLI